MGLFSSIAKGLGVAGDLVTGDFGSAAAGLSSFFGGEEMNEENLANARMVMDFNAEQAELARQFNAAEAEKARTWSSKEGAIARKWTGARATNAQKFARQMSNTAHQREAADLRRAGLNRILSVSKGGPGASAPVIAGPSASAPGASAATGPAAAGVLARVENAADRAVNTGYVAKVADSNIAKLKQEVMQSRATTARARQLTENEKQVERNLKLDEEIKEKQLGEIEARILELTQSAALKGTQGIREDASAKESRARRKLLLSEAEKSGFSARILEQQLKGWVLEGELDEGTYAKIMRAINRALPAASAVAGARRSFGVSRHAWE